MPVVPEPIRRATCTFCGGSGRLIAGRSAAPEGRRERLFICARCVEEAAATLLSRDAEAPAAKGASAFSRADLGTVTCAFCGSSDAPEQEPPLVPCTALAVRAGLAVCDGCARSTVSINGA